MKELIRKILKESIGYDFNNLSNEDLYQISKWGIEGSYSFSGCMDDENPIECGVQDFKGFLSTPWPLGLGDIPNNPIIYRIIQLKDIKDLNRFNLGKSWFSNPKQYEEDCFFDMLDYIKPKRNLGIYLLKGKININNIDIPHTLWERSTQWCENEIVIKDDSKIELLDIVELK